MKKKNKLKDINIITIRLAQVAALTVSCLVTLPTFAQSNCEWNGSTLTCDFDDPDPDPPGCNVIGCDSEGDGDDGGGNDNGGNNEYDPIVCYNLSQASPNTPGQPLVCATDPGDSLSVNYDIFIRDYLGSILGGLTSPCYPGDGCYWSSQFPYMTTQTTNSAINIFGDAFFNNFDYISARNAVWYILVATCNNTYSYSSGDLSARTEYNNCMGSQADFYFSMTPQSTSSTAAWSTSLGWQAPWGPTLSFSFGSGGSGYSNWVSDFLVEVTKERTCHNWYQALEAANCPNPNP